LRANKALYHCTNRCVRRAWLCGIDPDTKQNYEHRKQMVADRIKRLGEIFAVGICKQGDLDSQNQAWARQ
jgi:hypothetical protein